MNEAYIWMSILIAAGVSLLVRTLPLTLIRKQIQNPFLKSFLFYVPYVTLAVMTFPAMIEAAKNPVAGIAALAVGTVAAWLNAGLFPVAVLTCLTVFAVNWLTQTV